jgi:hypothetical protein
MKTYLSDIKKYFVLFALIFAFCSCNRHEPIQIPDTTPTSDVDIYIAGYEGGWPNKQIAIYWKNGVATALTDGTQNSIATDIAVIGNDVYISGYEGSYPNMQVAKYWKNGVAHNLTDGKNDAVAYAIVVQQIPK